ncbi:MAG: saccharopine dehydrogenase NADP-binding domain-containing protein [Bacteroidetes bacterium]|nr:saccharopine dehydrogenase NADP-binding domain-containing protein [Bacteroidota bacterium]
MTILVLGGYGGTGKVFCSAILKETNSNVIVAGRNQQKAKEWAEKLEMEFSPDRISYRCVDASNRKSLCDAFLDIDFVLVAATTTQYAKLIAEAALEAQIDYLDIYFQQNVYSILDKLKHSIKESGQCFITQAGFHPGLPAAFIRKGSAYFDTYDSAIVAFVMNARIEKPESVYELVDALSDYKADIYKNGEWKCGTYKDAVKIDFGYRFGVKSCVPVDMIEIRSIPELYHIKEVGVYVAGFNWFVDYVIFPLIMLSQIIRKGSLRHFWAKMLIWGINNFSRSEEGIVFILHAKGSKDGKRQEISFLAEHNSAYDFTVIPVIAFLKQYIEGSLRKPGLWMMGHIVNPDRMFTDMEKMGVKIQTQITTK